MTSAGDERHSTGSARILILEDDPWDAELAQRLLTGAGLSFSAVVADTRSAFTEQLAAFRPEVIISDFSLPGFTGGDALEIAQARCPEVPVIIWSGVIGDEAAVELIKRGATDYILKDRPARLPSAVQNALTQARQQAQLARIQGQLDQAQRLASAGRLIAAERAVAQTRVLLAAARQEVADATAAHRPAASGQPDVPGQPTTSGRQGDQQKVPPNA